MDHSINGIVKTDYVGIKVIYTNLKQNTKKSRSIVNFIKKHTKIEGIVVVYTMVSR